MGEVFGGGGGVGGGGFGGGMTGSAFSAMDVMLMKRSASRGE